MTIKAIENVLIDETTRVAYYVANQYAVDAVTQSAVYDSIGLFGWSAPDNTITFAIRAAVIQAVNR